MACSWKKSGYWLNAGLAAALLLNAVSAQSRRLNGPFMPETLGDVLDYLISPDGAFVVYVADQDTNDVYELYRTPLDGSGAPVQLNSEMVEGGNVGELFNFYAEFLISPDGSRVVYRADQELDERFELYSVPADGSS